MLLAVAATMVSYAAPVTPGTGLTNLDKKADLGSVSGDWYQYTSATATPSGENYTSISLAKTWSEATAWVSFDKAITLSKGDMLTLAFTIDQIAADGVVSLILQGANGQPAVIIGNEAYKSTNIAAATATLATSGFAESLGGNAQSLAFDSGHSGDRLQTVTPGATITSTASANVDILAKIAYSEQEDQFVMNLMVGGDEAKAATLNLGQSLSFDSLVVIASSDAVQPISGISLTVVPEPATATLSLFALAGLATRRRRH